MTKTELKNMMKVRSSVKHLSLLILKMSFSTLRGGFKKKKSAEFSALLKTHPPQSQSAGKK